MGPVLLSAADLILAFENQNAILLQHPVGFSQGVHVESVQLTLVRIHTKSTVDDVARPFPERFTCCRQEGRVKYHTGDGTILQRQVACVSSHHTICLRLYVKAQRWRLHTCFIEASCAVGWVTVDPSIRHMEAQDIADDLALVI